MDPSEIVDDFFGSSVADEEMRTSTAESDEGKEVAVHESQFGDVRPGEKDFPGTGEKEDGERSKRRFEKQLQTKEERTSLPCRRRS